jgi:GAF domain-containing protein
MRPSHEHASGRAILSHTLVHIHDVLADREYHQEVAHFGGWRSLLAVPMVREGSAVGVIWVARAYPGAFPDSQIALLRTFAEQAVIAIENVRLFSETKEALERQTATAEILKVISSSPTDVQPVFDAIARNAATLCGSAFANVFRYDGKLMHHAASHLVSPEQLEIVQHGYPAPPSRGRVAGRAILAKAVVCIENALNDPDYDHPVAAGAGWRRMFAVPMLRDGHPIGAIAVGWEDPGPIPEEQINLLRTFADQAVIAIENVRLFNETKEALER